MLLIPYVMNTLSIYNSPRNECNGLGWEWEASAGLGGGPRAAPRGESRAFGGFEGLWGIRGPPEGSRGPFWVPRAFWGGLRPHRRLRTSSGDLGPFGGSGSPQRGVEGLLGGVRGPTGGGVESPQKGIEDLLGGSDPQSGVEIVLRGIRGPRNGAEGPQRGVDGL